MEIFSVFANIGINAKDFNRGIEEAEGRGQSLGSAFLGVSKTIARAGLAIGASVKGIGIAALQVGGQFDSSLRTIEARTGMTAESMGKVGLAFRDLALDGNFSANEIARSFAYVAVAGQDSTEAIGIMENAMVLAGATGVNLGTAAYFLGNYLLKVGKDASYAERYINIFAETNRQTGIGLLTLQDYLFRANVTLQSTNITGYEASAMFGALYQAGIRGANAYSGVENALRSLLVPTEDQIAALDRLYVARHDENGQLKDGIDFLLALGHALGDLEGDTLSYYNALLGSTVAGSAFLGGIVDIKYTLPYMIDDIREAGDALNGTGTAFEMAALKQDTFAGGLGMMRAAGKD
ncbi:MAG: phage tail tape measure protein, partial [Defluviitaleaceae bacterium]|nr:phage tail tape measure protein [Defluviitaleaceae bacterium]